MIASTIPIHTHTHKRRFNKQWNNQMTIDLTTTTTYNMKKVTLYDIISQNDYIISHTHTHIHAYTCYIIQESN